MREGNPFFVEEVLADLLDRGLLERGDGGWSLRDAALDLGIPDSVHGVLAARIDLLPAEAKEALQAASVIGRSFSPGGLAALTGSSAEVRTLVERGFVRPTEPELVFKHALTREVAYGSLPKASRARLHAAFARWLETDAETGGRAGLLAHHYSEAVAPDIAELAWRDREDELEQLEAEALRWLRRAAELSLARFDLDDALSQLHRAAELAPGDAELWHAIGRVNALKFDGEAMWPAMERAIELTEGSEALAELYAELTFESTMRGGMWKRQLDHALVESWLARTLELADAGGAARAKALVTKAMWEDAAEPAEQAVALAERIDDPVLLSYAYWARSGAPFVELDFHEADRWAQRRFELLDRLTDPDKIAHIQYYGATAALAAGRPDEAETLVRKHDIVASRLSTHHEVHALGGAALRGGGARTLGRGSAASASRRAGRRRQRGHARACSLRGRSSRAPSRAPSSVSTARPGDSRRPQSSRAFKTVAWLLARPTVGASRTAARRPRPGRRRARVVRRDMGIVSGRQPPCAGDEARCADRARPAGRGRGDRDPPSSSRGRISSRLRYARSVARGATGPD